MNWKGQIFGRMRNWTANNRQTGVGNSLKKHYANFLWEYEQVRMAARWAWLAWLVAVRSKVGWFALCLQGWGASALPHICACHCYVLTDLLLLSCY
jgi:hypothetical protein